MALRLSSAWAIFADPPHCTAAHAQAWLPTFQREIPVTWHPARVAMLWTNFIATAEKSLTSTPLTFCSWNPMDQPMQPWVSFALIPCIASSMHSVSVSCKSETKFSYFSARLRRDDLACIGRDFSPCYLLIGRELLFALLWRSAKFFVFCIPHLNRKWLQRVLYSCRCEMFFTTWQHQTQGCKDEWKINTYLRNNNLAWLSALVKHKVYAPKRWVLWILQWALRPASCAGVSKKWARIYTRFLRLLMVASMILLAISKQSEKPRKLVGAMLQTFYIIRLRTDRCLALESSGIFPVGKGFLSLTLEIGSRCLWVLDTESSLVFPSPTFSTQLAERRCWRILAQPFGVLRFLLALLSRFVEFRSDMYFRHLFDAQGLEAQKGKMHHGIWFDISSFLLAICWWRDGPLTNECRSKDWEKAFMHHSRVWSSKGLAKTVVQSRWASRSLFGMLSWAGGWPIHVTSDASKSDRLGCWSWLSSITDADIGLPNQNGLTTGSLLPWSVSLGSTATNQTSFTLWTCPLRTLPGEWNSSRNRVGTSKLKSLSETRLWRLVTIFVRPATISKIPSWESMQLTIQSLSIKMKIASMLGWGVSRKRKRNLGIFLQRLRTAACKTLWRFISRLVSQPLNASVPLYGL